MKKLTFSIIFLITVLSFFVLNKTQASSPIKLVSPLSGEEKVLGVNQWFPATISANQTNVPTISAKAAIFIDTKNGQVLYAKNIHDRLPIASLVKVMTVLISLEHKKMEDQFVVSSKAADMEPDKMLLIAGEKLSLRELLDGIFLVSANDAAEVLAEGTTGNRDEFIRLMNEKGKQIGLTDTFYANPTGLDEDSNNSYSSAFDLAILTRFLIRNHPEVVDISQTQHILLPQTNTHQDYDMYTGINLLATYAGVVGFKTGFTPEAGLTLITLARKNGHEVIGVLLGSGDRRDEARDLLDYSFVKLL